MTRAFLAIPLPDDVIDALTRVQQGLPEGRAVAHDNLHLTLVFLGDVGAEALEDLHDTLSAVRAGPITLRIDGLDLFGGERPRSLWARVVAGPELGALQTRLESTARRAKIDVPRRRFVPHVTLARFRPGGGVSDGFHRYLVDRAGFALPAFDVHRFSLYTSTLYEDGPVYDVLAEYPLTG
ncbi:MAG: RNA 2',3'-cyclic phosphodiesterase [Rhodobacteraceae bacterium]|nr:RNA 2',3'-cyclic phosphodiesterase [Alphaproteobacteria bacterium]NNK66111.1 RNA 2',3'-cyclic phosphodiesterase [Paracoccaceae bacterium]